MKLVLIEHLILDEKHVFKYEVDDWAGFELSAVITHSGTKLEQGVHERLYNTHDPTHPPLKFASNGMRAIMHDAHVDVAKRMYRLYPELKTRQMKLPV